MKAPLFVPMKAGGPAGGALVVLGFVALLAALALMKRRAGATNSTQEAGYRR